MGDRRGQAPCRRQFFRAHEGQLRGIAFADVTEDENDANHARILIKDGRCAVVDMEFFSILADENGVVGKADNLARPPHHLHRVFNDSACALVVNAKNLCKWQAVRLHFFPSRKLLGYSVHENNFALGIAGDHRIPDTAQRGIQPLLAAIALVSPTLHFLDLQVVGTGKFLKEPANLPGEEARENERPAL